MVDAGIIRLNNLQ